MIDKKQQIIQIHGSLIHMVVMATQNSALLAPLESVLKESAKNDWHQLVAAIRKILAGQRDTVLQTKLDEEDGIILEAILMGIKNPQTLPDPKAKADENMAAPSIATLIYKTAHGDVMALQMLGDMAEQMNQVGGDMRLLAAAIRPMVDGERDANKLNHGLGDKAEKILLDVLDLLENDVT